MALLALGCSWTTEFVIINASEATVELRYDLKESSAAFAQAVVPPQVTSASEIASPSWRAAPAERSADNRSITVRLGPGEALRIATLSNYGSPSLESWQHFPLQHLEIRFSRGVLCHQGAAVLLAFTGDRERHVLVFSGTPEQTRLGTCDGTA